MAYKKTYRRRKHIKRKTRRQRRTRTKPRTRTGGFFKYRCSDKDLQANSDEYYTNCCNKTWANMIIPGRKSKCDKIDELRAIHHIDGVDEDDFFNKPFNEKPQPNNSTSTNSQTVVPY